MSTRESDFRLDIGNEHLKFAPHVIHYPVPSGQQILELAGHVPADQYLLFLWKTEALKEIDLNETIDLRNVGIEKFIAFHSDRSFRFELGGDRFEWGTKDIQGLVIKQLANIDPETHDVFLEQENTTDRLIEDDEIVNLNGDGIERFSIKPIRKFDIIVNSREEIVPDKHVTFDQVVELAFPGAPVESNVRYSMTYRNAASNPHTGELAEGGSVKVKKHGTIFNVTRTVQS